MDISFLKRTVSLCKKYFVIGAIGILYYGKIVKWICYFTFFLTLVVYK